MRQTGRGQAPDRRNARPPENRRKQKGDLLMARLRLLYGKMRRLWLCTFRRRHVERQIALRKGECRQCGTCCDLGFRCPFLKNDGLCRIYHSPYRPISCVKFPIDPRDIADVRLAAGRECGYRFEDAAPGAVAPPDNA